MVQITTRLIKVGNSNMVTIPKRFLNDCGVNVSKKILINFHIKEISEEHSPFQLTQRGGAATPHIPKEEIASV